MESRTFLEHRPFLALLLAIEACAGEEPALAGTRASIIYDEDDRAEPADSDALAARLARENAVALIPRLYLADMPDGTYEVRAPAYGETESLCMGERFIDQPAAASCSGVLVAEDIVATAAHCLGVGRDGTPDCSQHHYVFGYEATADATPIVLQARDVHTCREVLARLSAEPGASCRVDLALVRLDRHAERAIEPPSLRDTPLYAGERLIVIGFPGGLPVKVDRGARVMDARSAHGDYFTLDSDTFEHSSGSAVFDMNGRLAGLFVRGRRDYIADGGCIVANRVTASTTDGFEEATYAGAVAAALRAAAPGNDVGSHACRLQGAIDITNRSPRQASSCTVLPAESWDKALGAWKRLVFLGGLISLALARRLMLRRDQTSLQAHG